MSATSRVCRARGLWRTTRHTDKRAALHRSRPPADQSGKRVTSWTGKSPDTHDTRTTCCGHPREDAARKTVPWNLSFMAWKQCWERVARPACKPARCVMFWRRHRDNCLKESFVRRFLAKHSACHPRASISQDYWGTYKKTGDQNSPSWGQWRTPYRVEAFFLKLRIIFALKYNRQQLLLLQDEINLA